MKAAANDYTDGRLSVHFIRLMIPLVIGNILQQLYNAIDSIVISRYASSLEFAAIGIASSVMNLFLFAMIGACTGLSILMAQAFGARDRHLFRQYHATAILYGSILVVSGSILVLVLLPALLRVLQTPAELIQYTLSYLRIIIGGLLVSYLYNFYASMLRSIGRANVALSALSLAVLLNVGLDMFFIAVCHRGIAGAAAATLIAQVFSVLFCVLYLMLRVPDARFGRSYLGWNRSIASRMLHISLITGIHQVSLYIGKLFIQSFVNYAGTDMIMAFTATTRIESFANSFGDSGSAVTSILAAQNYGAGKKERVNEVFHTSLVILAVFGLLSAVVLYLCAPAACAFLLGGETTALPSAVSYLRRIALFYLFCFTGNTYAGFFEGTGRVKVPFVGALSHMTLRVILSFFWIPMAGLDAVAVATGLGWIGVNIGWEIYRRLRPLQITYAC